MASIFGHIAASTTLGSVFFKEKSDRLAYWLAAASAALPDADIIAFRLGIPYSSIWGHRGFTHSIGFAVLWGILLGLVFYWKKPNFKAMSLFFVLATLSHPLLDMLTNGGRGVALYWPLSEERIFFPFRPIQVSSIYPSQFFSEWGLQVLLSEAFWIGVPCLVLLMLSYMLKK